MSYSGTVRCSHCYRQGHNRRKRSQLTQDIKNEYESCKASAHDARSNGEHAAAVGFDVRANHCRREYMKRTKIDLETNQKVSNKKAKDMRASSISCGYCAKTGHTRRTCEALKVDKLIYTELTRRARKSILQEAKKVGMGVGSLVPCIRQGWHYPPGSPQEEYGHHLALRFVIGIEWDSTTAYNRCLYLSHVDAMKGLGKSETAYGRGVDVNSVGVLTGQLEAAQRFEHQLLHNVDSVPEPSLVPCLNPPTGWLDCKKLDLKQAFPSYGPKHRAARAYKYQRPNEEIEQVIRDLGLWETWESTRSY